MNTSAINSPLSIQPPTSNGMQSIDPSGDAGTFSQALTQEMNNRNDANAGDKSNAQDVQKDGANGETKNDAGKNTISDDSKVADKGNVSVGDKQAQDKDDDKKSDKGDADIIAFVANLTQSHQTAASTSADSKSAIADKLKGIDAIRLDISAAGDKANATAARLSLAASDGKDLQAAKQETSATGNKSSSDSNGKQSDFLAVLEKTVGNAGVADKSASQTAANFAPLLAANAQTIAPNSTALQRANELQNMQANTFSQQVGGADWDKALGQKVVWMVQGAQTSATMTLNPPDLGPMQITLNVNNNHATASFIAHHAEVRNALENAMPRLREMLGEAGIQLGQSNVSAGSSDQQAAFDNAKQSSSGRNASETNNATNEPALHVSHVRTPSSSAGKIDTFA